MILRPYQRDALAAIHEQFEDHQSTLLVMPTGCGKTATFSHVIKDRQEKHNNRSIVVAHREELIAQASGAIGKITGEAPDIELAYQWADQANWQGWRSKCIVTSVQTQCSGMNGLGRMTRFNPLEFGLAIIDEAHHACADSYRRVIEHYTSNPELRLLGVTATPNRHDELALGQIFKTCAFNYGILDAINDGWLVPVVSNMVHIEGLDLSQCRTTAGDLNGADLARVLEFEKPLLGMADSAFKLSDGRKTLVFAATCAQAERLAEILNRHESHSARFVSGKTPKDERREMFRDYKYGNFRFLVNVGVATEGFDEPAIEVIVMARPTKSTPLYTQMLGRGTRPLPGIVDFANADSDSQLRIGPDGQIHAAELRRKAIADSPKPKMEVLDFVGNSGRHKIIRAIDALGGTYSDEVVERAIRQAEREQVARTPEERLKEAAERLKAEKESEARKRTKIMGRAVFSTTPVNVFDVLGVTPPREFGWDKNDPPTEKQVAFLKRFGVEVGADVSKRKAGQLIAAWKARKDRGLATYKQVSALRKRGIDATNYQFTTAHALLDAISANGWRNLPEQRACDIISRYESNEPSAAAL